MHRLDLHLGIDDRAVESCFHYPVLILLRNDSDELNLAAFTSNAGAEGFYSRTTETSGQRWTGRTDCEVRMSPSAMAFGGDGRPESLRC
jgi:hypothetical protein